jgi:hypothetical protein
MNRLPNISLNGIDFHDAPKNAGTTVRMWLKFYEDGLPSNFTPNGYYNLIGIGLPRQWNATEIFGEQLFTPGADENSRWCIVRDPVDRFISAFTDKILRERLAPWTLYDCLSLLESGEMERIARSPEQTTVKQAACHMLGQCYYFGHDRKYFNQIFNILNMNQVRDFCEDTFFKMRLPDFHARNQLHSDVKKIELSKREICRVERIYEADYIAGWC